MAGVTYKSPIPQFRAPVTMLLIMKYGTWPMECDLYFRPINVLKCNCKWITDKLQLWQMQTWLVGAVVTCRFSENYSRPYLRLAVMFWWSPGTVVRVFHGIRVGECCLEIFGCGNYLSYTWWNWKSILLFLLFTRKYRRKYMQIFGNWV